MVPVSTLTRSHPDNHQLARQTLALALIHEAESGERRQASADGAPSILRTHLTLIRNPVMPPPALRHSV